MDGERSRFLMRLRIVPLPSAVIASLACPASCFSQRLRPVFCLLGLRSQLLRFMLPARFCLHPERVDGLRFYRCCTAS